MASTDRKELQEGVVGPLMDMMGNLSEEMRKNLSMEVSSINRWLDELNNKVDYMISRMDGNNFKRNDHHNLPSELPVLTSPATHTFPSQSVQSLRNMSDESEGYSIVTGQAPTQFDRRSSDPAEERRPDDKYNAEPKGFSNQTKEATATGKVKHTEATLNDEASRTENKPVLKIPTSQPFQLPAPRSETNNAYSSVPEYKPEEVENDRQSTNVPKASMGETLAQKQANKNTEEQFDTKDMGVRFESHPRHTDTSSSDISFSGPKRPGLFNFGNTGVHTRPQSPPPTRDNKHKISYNVFKKSRTEFTKDNRTVYLNDAFNITESGNKDRDQPTTGSADKNMSRGENQKSEKLPKRSTDEDVGKSTGAVTTEPKQRPNIGEMSKNQQPALSGFKNEHGDDDNRFMAAAHDERSHASVMRRCLSNLKLVKNGLRRPVTDTDADSRLHDGVAEGFHHSGWSQTLEDNRSGELVSDDVLYSIIEKERLSAGDCSDMKSEGIDTVICLDTSSSMAGKPLTTAIEAINKILDGFENNAIYHDLEENVALVTFGHENKIRFHLTNDYGVIKDDLENITAGGPSPLWLGLALSLSEIKERGGACEMGTTTVLPRIILITDGFASRKNLLSGEDSSEVIDDQVLREILSLLSTCTSFTSYMECIKPRPCHEDLLRSLTNGRIYTTDEVEHVTEFFKVQEKANDILKKVSSGEMNHDEKREAIKASMLSGKGKDDLKNIISEGLSSTSQQDENDDVDKNDQGATEEEETDPTDQSKSSQEEIQEQQPDSIPPTSLDVVDDVKAPPFATAVVPNPEWIGFAARQHFTGTVIGARKKGLMKILWSDGTMEKCKFGVNGQYDFQVSKDQAIDYSDMHVGSMVARGQDWRWKDQDGGEGSVGVALKVDSNVVHVIWPHGGQGNYRYGYNKKFDLSLCKTRKSTTDETNFAWYIEVEEGLWTPFPSEVNESIESMYKAKHTGTFLVKMDQNSLRISIQHLQARDPSTQLTYSIERRESSVEE